MDEIINYVMENPENTNPNVLRNMLENYNSSGGGLLIVNVVPDETTEEEGVYVADKTAKELYEAFLAGRNVVCYYDLNYHPFVTGYHNEDDDTYTVYFSTVDVIDGSSVSQVRIQIEYAGNEQVFVTYDNYPGN